MPQHLTAEIIYCQGRARLAREKAEAATTDRVRNDYLAAEGRWLALAHSHELQQRLSRMLDDSGTPRMGRDRGCAFEPEVVATISSAFRAVVAELDLLDRDEAVAIRAARRIIDLAASGESDPEKLKHAALRWMTM
jgi:hypothetical protein